MNGHNGLPGRDGRDGAKGQQGVAGPPGLHGFKGEIGRDGAKGDKGVAGAPGPRSSTFQKNWKQCAWKIYDGRDIGLIKVSLISLRSRPWQQYKNVWQFGGTTELLESS